MIIITPYQDRWLADFKTIAASIRAVAGSDALAIHHIGSTSVPGLAAKDIIDIQLTVTDFSLPFRAGLESLGFNYRDSIQRDHTPPGMQLTAAELEKRYFNRPLPATNLHIRIEGHFNQRYPLLCRDYLRATPMARHAYAEIKRQLAHYFPTNNDAYYAIKDPVFDVIMAGAFVWAEQTAWQPPPTDA